MSAPALLGPVIRHTGLDCVSAGPTIAVPARSGTQNPAAAACSAAALPACRSRTAVAPLERLKILMQVQGNQKMYTGVWQVRWGC